MLQMYLSVFGICVMDANVRFMCRECNCVCDRGTRIWKGNVLSERGFAEHGEHDPARGKRGSLQTLSWSTTRTRNLAGWSQFRHIHLTFKVASRCLRTRTSS